MEKLTVKSTAFENAHPIPKKYTGDGQDVSPPLSWSGVPSATRELALICDDPDAPTPQPWVHWVMYRIPPSATSLPEGVPTKRELATPDRARQGVSSFDKLGYGGPAPPKGHGVHHYHFKIYALDAPITLEPGQTKAALEKAMRGHIVAEGELVGTYQR
jgi:Raf kinase inhibitor-like YbhB/YbcL family protein